MPVIDPAVVPVVDDGDPWRIAWSVPRPVVARQLTSLGGTGCNDRQIEPVPGFGHEHADTALPLVLAIALRARRHGNDLQVATWRTHEVPDLSAHHALRYALVPTRRQEQRGRKDQCWREKLHRHSKSVGAVASRIACC